MANLAVGDRVVAVRSFWDPFAKVTIPIGTQGVIVAAGPDARYGFVNVTWEVAGATAGMPSVIEPPMRTDAVGRRI